MNAAAPYGAPVAIPIACVTAVVVVALLAIGIAWARRATAPYGTHCKPRPPRERSRTPRLRGQLAGLRYALLRPLRDLQIRRWTPELRGCIADAAPDAGPPLSASGAVPPDYPRDAGDGVIHIEPDGSITVRPRTYDWSPLRDTAADGIAVIGPALVRPYVYREGL